MKNTLSAVNSNELLDCAAIENSYLPPYYRHLITAQEDSTVNFKSLTASKDEFL